MTRRLTHAIASPMTACAVLALSAGGAAADDYDSVRAALDAGDHETAYAALAALGDEGDTLAMLMLANLELTDFARADPGLAIGWLEHAADAGNIQAMIELGAIYERHGPWLFPEREASISLAVGYPEALHWYGRAADAGSAEALYRIGQIYRLRVYNMIDETVTPEDEDRLAREFLERAVAAGSVDAITPLAMIMRRDEPARHAEMIVEAATHGEPTAVGMVAARPDMFGVEEPVEAVAWAIAAKVQWGLSEALRTPLFTMSGAETPAEFLAAMDAIIEAAPPDVRTAAQARADEITAGWTSLLPGHSAGAGGEDGNGGAFFGRD